MTRTINPKVSVIIPIYNSEKHLNQCLDSITRQTLKEIEIICVNDGSTDCSGNIIDEYAKDDCRVKVISQKNKGVSEARNIGLRIAKGEYISFVDSDDWIDFCMLEYLYQKGKANNCDIVMSSYQKEFTKHSTSVHIFEKEGVLNIKDVIRRLIGPIGEELNAPQKVDLPVSPCMQIIKNDKIRDVKFVDTEQIGTEDLLYQIMAYSKCNSFMYVDKPFYHYRRSDYGTLTTKYMPEKFERWQRLYEIIDRIIEDNHFDNIFRVALYNREAVSMIGLGLNEIMSKEGVWKQARRLSQMLSTESYVKAFATFNLDLLATHWKIFFLLCKYKLTVLLVVLLHIIEFLRKRVH